VLRLLGQLVVLGTKIVYGTVRASITQAVSRKFSVFTNRVFMVPDAKINVASPAAAKGPRAAGGGRMMDVEEARQILNVPADASEELVRKV
jgi:hypothetical protein